MDAKLRGAIREIARDRRSGAAELALRAAKALAGWQKRCAHASDAERLAAAKALVRAQPAMAALVRLANEIALADSGRRNESLGLRLARLARTIRLAPGTIAIKFARTLPRGHLLSVATHSYSSTVIRALVAARRNVAGVLCGESLPGGEGRKTAQLLRRAGVHAMVLPDAALSRLLRHADALVVGADHVGAGSFRNKAGTAALAARCIRLRRPVWVLADSTKFFPLDALARHGGARSGARRSALFDRTRLRGDLRVLTERGWVTPAAVRRAVRRIEVSPRLRALVR